MHKLKTITLVALCFIIGLSTCLFVGCGNNENKIRLNEVTHSIFYAPLYVALNMGFFEDEGLEVSLESATGSDASMTALLSGSADVVLVGPETVVYSASTQDHPVVFGQLTQRDGSFIVSRDALDEEFNLQMLKGTTIIGGRAGGLPAMTLQYIIENAGLTIGENTSAGEVNLRTDVAFPMVGSEFETSGAEYCTLFEPTATNMQNKGSGYVVSSVGKFSGSIPYTCFATKSSFLENKSEQAEKFLRAVKRGYDYIAEEDSLTVAHALEKSFIGTSVQELQVAVEQYLSINAWCSDPAMSEESFNTLIEIINNYSPLSSIPSYEDLVDNTIANLVA